MSLCILMCVYCHDIPSCTPWHGYHRVTKVAKNAHIAKMAENCINCTRPTPPSQILWSQHLKTRLGLKVGKTKKFVIFNPKGVGCFFNIL